MHECNIDFVWLMLQSIAYQSLFFKWCRYASSFRFSGDHVDKRSVDSFRRRKTRIIAIDALCSPGMRQFKFKYLLRYGNFGFNATHTGIWIHRNFILMPDFTGELNSCPWLIWWTVCLKNKKRINNKKKRDKPVQFAQFLTGFIHCCNSNLCGFGRETNKAFCGFLNQSKWGYYEKLFQDSGNQGSQYKQDDKDANVIAKNFQVQVLRKTFSIYISLHNLLFLIQSLSQFFFLCFETGRRSLLNFYWHWNEWRIYEQSGQILWQ